MEIILFFIAIALLGYYSSKIKGYFGEKKVSAKLRGLPQEEYILLNNVMLRSDYGLTQIDHVLVSVYGIFVIETKNYKGWITGGEYSDTWTKNMYGKKYSFRNPIKQNYAHVKALQSLLGISEKAFFIPVVVFSGQSDLKVKTNSHVIYMRQLKKFVESYVHKCFSEQDIVSIAHTIQNANTDSKDTRKEHLKQIKSKKNERYQAVNNNACPQCGAPLKHRTGKYGSFLGCSNYPRCRYTKKG